MIEVSGQDFTRAITCPLLVKGFLQDAGVTGQAANRGEPLFPRMFSFSTAFSWPSLPTPFIECNCSALLLYIFYTMCPLYDLAKRIELNWRTHKLGSIEDLIKCCFAYQPWAWNIAFYLKRALLPCIHLLTCKPADFQPFVHYLACVLSSCLSVILSKIQYICPVSISGPNSVAAMTQFPNGDHLNSI